MRMLLNERGIAMVVAAIHEHFRDVPPDIICIDPIRNLLDGGPDGAERQHRHAVLPHERLREAVNPDAGLILCHHTRKTNRKEAAQDPFQALSGASSLRGFYTAGILMHRPDEDRPERMLHFELRNGPAIAPMLVDKIDGHWIRIDPKSERLVRKSFGEKPMPPHAQGVLFCS